MNKPSLKTKVEKALEEVRPLIESHGGGFRVLSAEGGRVKIKIEGACVGCPMAQATFGAEMEEMIKGKVKGIKEIKFV
jgi:Fe-S cluster biogenesis protein NfuA